MSSSLSPGSVLGHHKTALTTTLRDISRYNFPPESNNLGIKKTLIGFATFYPCSLQSLPQQALCSQDPYATSWSRRNTHLDSCCKNATTPHYFYFFEVEKPDPMFIASEGHRRVMLKAKDSSTEMQHREEAAALPRGQLSEQGNAAWHGNDPHPVTVNSMSTAKEEGRALPHNIHFTFLPGEAEATSSPLNECCSLGCQSPTHTGT